MPPSPSDARARRLDAVIDAAIGEERIVGAVVLVAEDGQIVYRRAAGHADREAGRPTAEDSIFRLASVTKPLVAAAALSLAEAGVLGLDDPVTRFLPGFRPKLADGSEPAITVRQLLTHTSGLIYGYPESAGISEGIDRPGRGMVENLERIAAQPLAFAPGTAWRYSVAIDVLGGLLEQAAGAGLPAIVARHVTGPLGLADTEFTPTKPERLAAAYADGKPRPIRMAALQPVQGKDTIFLFAPDRCFDPASFPSGGAGMVGTAGDFLAFLEAVRTGGGPILSPASAALLGENAIGTLDTGVPGRGFSLGWSIARDPAAAGVPYSPGSWQWGGVYGHSWFVDPARRLSVVAFSNTAVAGVDGAYPEAIRNAVYG
ncbi:serine hydrolase domain-containing protein [Labrys monachus]|uniref:CubicO group peptidase (Beta-lactamase class C family) n=1 Tax=Labrys monachus TaxID=217067 RepID=A0ABU0FMU5_9HYPH|nr:serine hydrolase domain-containing protein [Labrys monachus]MDQ0395938.1 CubicO group peptidase (beta-lactamase class C family) [Labrys monachus]